MSGALDVPGRLVDALGLYLTGGASNKDPFGSLGGVASTTRVVGLAPLVSSPVPAFRVDHVFPANATHIAGEEVMDDDALGVATLRGASDAGKWLPPDDAVGGNAVAIAAGETKIAYGDQNPPSGDPVQLRSKGIRFTRETGWSATGNASLRFLLPMNHALGLAKVKDGQRSAGYTSYRAIMLRAHGKYGVLRIRLWMPPWTPLPGLSPQAVFSLGLDPVEGATIQSIPKEDVAPTGVTFVTPTTEGAALEIHSMRPGAYRGLWIRRVIPAGAAATPLEVFKLTVKYQGA